VLGILGRSLSLRKSTNYCSV